jgi:hypothetical protein
MSLRRLSLPPTIGRQHKNPCKDRGQVIAQGRACPPDQALVVVGFKSPGAVKYPSLAGPAPTKPCPATASTVRYSANTTAHVSDRGIGKRSLAAVRRTCSPGAYKSTQKVLARERITVMAIPTPQTASQTVKCSRDLCCLPRGRGPSAFPLVRALLVGATGFEPVISSVSDPTSHYRRVQRTFKKRERWSENRS